MAKDDDVAQLAEQVEEAKKSVEAVYSRVKEEQELFDRYLASAVDADELDDYIESYLNLRDSGLDFSDAFITAAEERDIELKEKEDEDK